MWFCFQTDSYLSSDRDNLSIAHTVDTHLGVYNEI